MLSESETESKQTRPGFIAYLLSDRYPIQKLEIPNLKFEIPNLAKKRWVNTQLLPILIWSYGLIETVLLSTYNICFWWEIKKIFFQYALLSGGLILWYYFLNSIFFAGDNHWWWFGWSTCCHRDSSPRCTDSCRGEEGPVLKEQCSTLVAIPYYWPEESRC